MEAKNAYLIFGIICLQLSVRWRSETTSKFLIIFLSIIKKDEWGIGVDVEMKGRGRGRHRQRQRETDRETWREGETQRVPERERENRWVSL